MPLGTLAVWSVRRVDAIPSWKSRSDVVSSVFGQTNPTQTDRAPSAIRLKIDSETLMVRRDYGLSNSTSKSKKETCKNVRRKIFRSYCHYDSLRELRKSTTKPNWVKSVGGGKELFKTHVLNAYSSLRVRGRAKSYISLPAFVESFFESVKKNVAFMPLFWNTYALCVSHLLYKLYRVYPFGLYGLLAEENFTRVVYYCELTDYIRER